MRSSLIKSTDYIVTVGGNIYDALTRFLNTGGYTTFYILCDENTLHHCLPDLVTFCPALRDAEIIEIESGEFNKSLEISAHIWETLMELKADKHTLMINLGGGMVSDLGGFCASVYKRGIDFIHIPTTLLAMADASVGGKTGINFSGIKNSIGSFAQPKAVFIQPAFLNTLPQRHYRNGLAEVYKIALISDAEFWASLNDMDFLKNEITLIKRSIQLKNNIVLKDPFEKNLRKILNFGHTIGHAVEALSMDTKHPLLHGEAIVAGMMMESHISFQKKLISKAMLSDVLVTFISVFKPSRLDHLPVQGIIDAIKNDKKTKGNKSLFALIDRPGNCLYDVAVTETQIKKSFDYYNTLV